jgi:hypothetical protein
MYVKDHRCTVITHVAVLLTDGYAIVEYVYARRRTYTLDNGNDTNEY